MKAFNLARIDKEYDMHLQAWLNAAATATKETGSGKNAKQVSIYKNFKEFFDYEKRIKEVDQPNEKLSPKQRKMAYLALQVNARGEV